MKLFWTVAYVSRLCIILVQRNFLLEENWFLSMCQMLSCISKANDNYNFIHWHWIMIWPLILYCISKLIYWAEIVTLPLSEVVKRDKTFNKLHSAKVFCHKLMKEKYHRTREQKQGHYIHIVPVNISSQ